MKHLVIRAICAMAVAAGLSGDNEQIARQIDDRVRQIAEAYRMR